jgi:TRAP-type mannitol/chloroaromatic compound transport system permease small subunit
MSKQDNFGFIFSNEDSVMRVAATANVTSWLVLLAFVATFVTNFWPLFNGTVPFSELFNQPASLVNVFYILVMGVVYFSILQGVSRLLHLGLDLYYAMDPGEEEDTVE